MGWLFGKKKPKVPLPQGHQVEGTLRFPNAPPAGRVIEPNKVKEAVGMSEPTQEEMPSDFPALPSERNDPFSMEDDAPLQTDPSGDYPKREIDGPLFVKVEVYQRILGELDGLKLELSHLSSTQRQLEQSEFNEESHFDKLKKIMRGVHDNLLETDKTLFKTQGD